MGGTTPPGPVTVQDAPVVLLPPAYLAACILPDVQRGDIQEQRGTFEARGQAAYRGWAVRLARKMGFVAGALFFWFVFFWACKRK